MKAERYEDGPIRYQIRSIEGDMEPGPRMDLIITTGGDAIITILDSSTGDRAEITINNGAGGTHTPGLSGRLSEVAEYLYMCEQNKDYGTRYMMARLEMLEKLNKPQD